MPRYTPQYMGPMAGSNFGRRPQGGQLQAAGNEMRRYTGPDARPAGDRGQRQNNRGVSRLREMLSQQQPNPNPRAREVANPNARFMRQAPTPTPPGGGFRSPPTPQPPGYQTMPTPVRPPPISQPPPDMTTMPVGPGVPFDPSRLRQPPQYLGPPEQMSIKPSPNYGPFVPPTNEQGVEALRKLLAQQGGGTMPMMPPQQVNPGVLGNVGNYSTLAARRF